MNSKSNDVDLLAVAVVREYLSRKGYKATLSEFDKESMKREKSIQNRKVLAEELGIMEMVIKNKERGVEALKTFLEMIVYEFLSAKDISSKCSRKLPSTSSSRSSQSRSMSIEKVNMNDSLDQSSPLRKTLPCLKTLQKDRIDLDFIPASNKNDIAFNTSPTRLANLTLESDSNNLSPASSARRRKLVHNMMMQDTRNPIQRDSSIDYFSSSLVSKTTSKRSSLYAETNRNYKNENFSSRHSNSLENGSYQSEHTNSNRKTSDKSINRRTRNVSNKHVEVAKITTDLTMTAIDVTSDNLFNSEVLDNYEDDLTYRSEGISLDTAIKLKVLLLGSATKYFNNEWTQQGFRFGQHPLLKYGLVQEKGGPCGLLASVQAVILKHMLFMSSDIKLSRASLPQPKPSQQKSLLLNALTDIFQQISQKKAEVIIALPSRSSKFSANKNYKNDNFTEKLQLYHLSPVNEIKKFLSKNLFHFTNTNGCILFLYSAVLSYGIENIRNTMDESNGTLMGSHGYCTQEMVNMLLTGKPVSNVFDNVVELDAGGQHKLMLHGIKTKNDIGFLSLYEHYQSCKVGDNYKNPNYPIWVVCSESHFSVLFSPVQITKELTSFDLYYYDGLGRQDEEIRLSVSLKSSKQKPSDNDELVPPLEHCIRTKWTSATVSWNGSEPIL